MPRSMHDDWGACVLPDGTLRLVPVGLDARARRARRLHRVGVAVDLVTFLGLVGGAAAMGGAWAAVGTLGAAVALRWAWRTR